MLASIPNWTKLFILNWVSSPLPPPTPILFSDVYFYSVQLKVGEWLLQMMPYLLNAQTRRRAITPYLILITLSLVEGVKSWFGASVFSLSLGSLFVWSPLLLMKGGRVLMRAHWDRVHPCSPSCPFLTSSLEKEGNDYHLLSIY